MITVLTSAIVGEVTAGLRTSDGVGTTDPNNGVCAWPPSSPSGRAACLRSVTDPRSGKTIAQLLGMSVADEIASASGSVLHG